MVDKSAAYHCIGRALHLFGRNFLSKTVPAVPSHWRSKRNTVTTLNPEFSFGCSFCIFRFQHNVIGSGLRKFTCNDTCFSIDFKSFWQLSSRKSQRAVSGSCNKELKRRTRPHSKYLCTCNFWKSRRFWSQNISFAGHWIVCFECSGACSFEPGIHPIHMIVIISVSTVGNQELHFFHAIQLYRARSGGIA